MEKEAEATTLTDLLVCPWCGRKPFVDDDWFDGCAIRCNDQRCAVQPGTGWRENLEKAVEVWNQRTGS